MVISWGHLDSWHSATGATDHAIGWGTMMVAARILKAIGVYERIIEDDVEASAIAIAAALYQLAMRDEMLPRLPAAQMPPLPTRP